MACGEIGGQGAHVRPPDCGQAAARGDGDHGGDQHHQQVQDHGDQEHHRRHAEQRPEPPLGQLPRAEQIDAPCGEGQRRGQAQAHADEDQGGEHAEHDQEAQAADQGGRAVRHQGQNHDHQPRHQARSKLRSDHDQDVEQHQPQLAHLVGAHAQIGEAVVLRAQHRPAHRREDHGIDQQDDDREDAVHGPHDPAEIGEDLRGRQGAGRLHGLHVGEGWTKRRNEEDRADDRQPEIDRQPDRERLGPLAQQSKSGERHVAD